MRTSDLDDLAHLRYGVVLAKDVVAAGFDADLPFREVKAGRWQRLLPGIYFTSASPPDLRARCHASLLHAGAEGVITGTAGCALRGLADPPDAEGEITVLLPHKVRVIHSEFCHVLRTRSLTGSQVLRAEGRADLAVAHLDRCLVDGIRREADLSAARALAARVVRDKRLHWEKVVEAAGRPGGSAMLRRVVRDFEDGIRSSAEGSLHDHLLPAARSGVLPPYLLNPSLFIDGELVGSPDAYFPGLGLGDEMDSRKHHGSEEDLDATLLRHERISRHGLYLNHTTPRRFEADPAAHVAKLASLVEERRALPDPEPPGLIVLGRGPLLPDRTPWPQVEERFRF